jgi:predicted enzyme related to lactoylglutathione lyase
MPYVQVADVDRTIAKAKRLGCDVKVEGVEAPGVGLFGVLLDPLGASLGVLQPA